MSFVFRGSRADIEAGGFPGFAPERRAMRIHAGSRPVNSNSLAFLVTVLILFMVLNSHQMSPNFLLWLVLGVFLMATSLRMYATCQQLQAQAQAHATAANGFLGHTELRVHVPPTIALATRGQLQSLRLHLALLDREFDDLDYDALRALDADNSPHAPSMSEEEINALPVFRYKVQAQQGSTSSRKSDGPPQLSASLTGSGNEKKQDSFKADGTSKTPEDELTCSVCLEQVAVGDLLRSLPCLHQFHVNCIDPWLHQQGTCPVCKHQVSDGWHSAGSSEEDASYMVSSSAEKVYPINSPLKKRKSQYDLIDPRLLSLKYKFRNRLSWQEDESATTESLGYDGICINKNSGTDMVSIPEELDSCENTLSLFGGCIEVDSKNGIEGQSMRKMFEARASASSSSSNNYSPDTFSSSRSSGTRETDSWVMHDVDNTHPGLMLQPQYDDLERIYDVLEQYDDVIKDDLMKDEIASGDVHGYAANVMDEKLYSNGVDDFQLLPAGQIGYHGEKKLTIDQEFEQYFSRLML